jgi:hypothetical protein
VIKGELKKSTLCLFFTWKSIKRMLKNQLSSLQSTQATQQVRHPTELSQALYSVVFGWISSQGLRLVEAQRKRQKPLPPCTQSFTRSTGLPCAHRLQELRRPLLLTDFHPHWRLERGLEAPQLILEPRQQIDRFRRSAAIPQSSTRREPCAFEAVEQQQRKQAVQCTRCGRVGHNRRSPTCPLQGTE